MPGASINAFSFPGVIIMQVFLCKNKPKGKE